MRTVPVEAVTPAGVGVACLCGNAAIHKPGVARSRRRQERVSGPVVGPPANRHPVDLPGCLHGGLVEAESGSKHSPAAVMHGSSMRSPQFSDDLGSRMPVRGWPASSSWRSDDGPSGPSSVSGGSARARSKRQTALVNLAMAGVAGSRDRRPAGYFREGFDDKSVADKC